ncbi:MAG: hypothetical protein AB8B94_19745 [Hyphomicrobiales bacterium]
MSILSKLTLTATSPREPITPLARKRIKLLQKLEQQIETAEAEARDEVFMEEIKRWVRNEESGEKVWSPNKSQFVNGGGKTNMAHG